MRFDVWLIAFEPGKAPARALVDAYRIDMQEALTLELTLPTIVARDLSEGAAARAVLELRGIGGRAEARPADPKAPFGFDLPFTESGWDDDDTGNLAGANAGDGGAQSTAGEPLAIRAPSRGPTEHLAPLKEAAESSEEGPDIAKLPAPVKRGRKVESAKSPEPSPAKIAEPSPAKSALDISPRRAPRPSQPRNDIPLQVVDVEPSRRAKGPRTPEASAPNQESGFDFGSWMPVAGAAAVAIGALYFTLSRGHTALLGTADTIGFGVDTVAFAAAAFAVLLSAVLLFTDRQFLDAGPGLVVVLLCAGSAYALNNAREPVVSADSEVGDEVEGLLTRSQVHFVGLDEASMRRLIESMRQAGAISVRAAAPVEIFGTTAYHGLAVNLPPGTSARARIADAYRSALTQAGVTPQATPPAEDQTWIISLSGQ